jgi:type IV pilus assembly protein PilO
MSGDFAPSNGRDFGSEPAYPTVFGIALTPTVSGALVAVLGVGAAAYLLLNQVQPAWEQYQTLQAEAEQKETQIQQRGNIQKKIDDANKNLAQARQRRTEVYSLFADERTLDTLLLDLNRLVNARQAKLSSFTPSQEPTAVITDGSLGSAVNGKLKRKEITVNLEGSYEQTQSIMRSVERLQPLLLVQSFNSQLDQSSQKITVDRRGRLVPVGRPETNLKTSFKLQALLPLSPQEAAAAAAPTPPAK